MPTAQVLFNHVLPPAIFNVETHWRWDENDISMFSRNANQDFFSFQAVHDVDCQRRIGSSAFSICDNFYAYDKAHAANVADPIWIFALKY